MQSKLLNLLGGETLRESSPLVYDALSNVTICDASMLSNSSEPGVLDVYLKTEEIFSDSSGIGTLQRNGFLTSASFVAVISNLYDKKTNNLIDTFNEYWENNTYSEVKRYSSSTLAKQASKNDLRLETIYTWSQDGKSVMEYTEDFSVAQFSDSEPIITKIDVTAPRAKNKALTVILYDREAFLTEHIDYHYIKVLSKDQKSSKVMMPFAGSLVVNEGFEILDIFTSILADIPKMHLILENGGTIAYNYTPKEFAAQFTISTDKKTLTWSFNDDWRTEIDLSHFSVKTIVNFTCQFTLIVRKKTLPGVRLYPKVMITSAKSVEHRESGAIEIEPIQIQWGCLAKNTKITMADGSKKKISDIIVGEWVQTLDGKSEVTNITKGMEQQLVFLQTYNGLELSMTETHPVKTKRGFSPASNLTAADIISTIMGESHVKSIYMKDYNDEVYNLVLNPSAAIVCNDIIAGDFAMQNSPQIQDHSLVEHTPLQIEFSRLMSQLKD